MPTNPVSADTMQIGSKGGGGHWTRAQVEARQVAAAGMKREHVVLRMPRWLSKNARVVYRRICREIAELELLDNLDVDLLATYCDAIVQHRCASQGLIIRDADGNDLASEERIKIVQAWARLIASLADKLGFSPLARARLAKRKATPEAPSALAQLLDDVEEFVNSPEAKDER